MEDIPRWPPKRRSMSFVICILMSEKDGELGWVTGTKPWELWGMHFWWEKMRNWYRMWLIYCVLFHICIAQPSFKIGKSYQ